MDATSSSTAGKPDRDVKRLREWLNPRWDDPLEDRSGPLPPDPRFRSQIDVIRYSPRVPAYPGDSTCKSNHVHGWSKWFMESPKFKLWRKTDSKHRTLICWGHSLSGKTMMTFVVTVQLRLDQRSNTESERIGVCSLRCDWKRGPKPAEKYLLALVAQLCSQLRDGEIPECVWDLYDDQGETRTQDEIVDILGRVMSGVFDCVFLLVDALYVSGLNYRQSTRSDLTRAFKRLHREQKHLKFLFTCRMPENVIEDEQALLWELRPSREVLLGFLMESTELGPRAKDDEEEYDEVMRGIADGADGLIGIACRALTEIVQDSRLYRLQLTNAEAVLGRMPEQAAAAREETYAAMMQLIDEKDTATKTLAMTALLWLLHPFEPMTGPALEHAVAIDEDVGFDEAYVQPVENIVAASEGLIKVDGASGTDLVTLRDEGTARYLRKHGARLFPDADHQLARLCVKYLQHAPLTTAVLETDASARSRFPLATVAARAAGAYALRARTQTGAEVMRALLTDEAVCDSTALLSGLAGLREPHIKPAGRAPLNEADAERVMAVRGALSDGCFAPARPETPWRGRKVVPQATGWYAELESAFEQTRPPMLKQIRSAGVETHHLVVDMLGLHAGPVSVPAPAPAAAPRTAQAEIDPIVKAYGEAARQRLNSTARLVLLWHAVRALGQRDGPVAADVYDERVARVLAAGSQLTIEDARALWVRGVHEGIVCRWEGMGLDGGS